MTIQVGERLPPANFMTPSKDGPKPVSTDDVFAGKRVALFAVPGAFTPTCDARHLPSYVERAAELKGKGVDEIVCTSSNDVFVLQAWNKAAGSDDITMLADGNGAFAKAVGLDADLSKFGMGVRSKRYSMVVNDGVVESVNVEEGPGVDVSGADYMLTKLDFTPG